MADTATSPWQIATVVIAIISITITIAIFLKNRKIKSLSYEILANTQLLTLSKDLKEKIKVYYTIGEKEEQIEDLSVMIVKVTNDGNEPIKPGDYEKSLKILLGPRCRLVNDEIIQVYPENLSPQLVYGISQLEKAGKVTEINLELILLNPNDSITLKLLLSGATDDIKFSARIAGVSNLKDKTIKGRKDGHKYIMTVAMTSMATAMGLLALSASGTHFISISNFFILLLLFITLILLTLIYKEYLSDR